MAENNICPNNPTLTCMSPGPINGGCCRVIPQGRPVGFSVSHRNPGHWDIVTRWGRAFRIRGVPGEVTVLDEREDAKGYANRITMHFDSVSAAMSFCADQLMIEVARHG